MSVFETELPPDAFLQRYAQREDCYTDCYCMDVPGSVDLSHLITRFYQTPLFRAERLVLKVFARKGSTDNDVAALANETTTSFAAWDVEARDLDQILLCDMGGRTRSWLMARPHGGDTRLYFGSAVTPPKEGEALGVLFNVLLGPHRIYTRLLLGAAGRRLR